MSTLSGNTIASSYPSLLRYDNFTGNTSATNLVPIVDGLGNRTPLSIAGSKIGIRDSVDFTLATEVDFDGSKLKVSGTDIDFTNTNTTGITKNVAVKTPGGRQPAIDGLLNYSAGTGINITQDISTNTFTWSTEGGDIIKIGSGITTVEGKAVYWNGSDWSANPTAINAYDKLIGIANGTNTLTDGVIIGGLITKGAQTGYTAGDLYLPNTAGGFETNKNSIYSPGYIRGVGHSLGSVGIVLNPDIFYSASTLLPPTPTPTMSPTMTPTPTLTPTPTPAPAFDTDAALLLADVLSAGGTLDATISAATNTLFTELKSNGFYDKLVFYPFIGGNSASHALFGKRTSGTTYDMTFNGGVTHSASGITMNAANTNADWTALPWSASTATIGNRSMGIYSVKAPNPGNNQYDVGSYDSATWPKGSQIIRFGGDSYIGWNVSFSTLSNTDVLGFFANSLTGSTSGTATFFENGSSVGTATSNDDFFDSQVAKDANRYGGWLGADRGTGFRSDKTYSWFYIGQYFTDSEMGTLSTIINDFQTSLGRNTY